MSQVRGEGHGNGHSVFTIILPYLEQVAIYNAYNFWIEVEHEANLTAVRTRMATYLCPDNPAAEDLGAREVLSLKEGNFRETEARFPESKSSFGKGHYGANWGGGRGTWGEDFLKKRGDYLGVMMTVIAPDGEVKADDGKPKARVVSFQDIVDGTATTLAMAEKRDSFGWAVGGWGGSEFDVHTRPTTRRRRGRPQGLRRRDARRGGQRTDLRRGSPPADAQARHRRLVRSVDTAGGEILDPEFPGLSPVLSTPDALRAEETRRTEKVGQAVGRMIQELRGTPPRPRGRETG